VKEDSEIDRNQSVPRNAHGKSRFGHVSVLLKETLDFLAVRRGGTYIDATLGLGGHSFEIARRLGKQGRLIGFDKDTHAIELAQKRLSEPPAELKDDWPEIEILHASFADIAKWVPKASADGLLADVGVSSMQFDDATRGFSFQAEGPLDMRMDPESELTADQVVNQFDENDLANLIYEFGEERRSRRIARAIVRARPVKTTAHLAQVISAAARPMKFGKGIHPATLTFQALRIFVNRELDDLKALLEAAPQVLKKGGRLG
jgi:16S rRNA (cytosine1402-N4)-methyltransferase